MSHRCRDRAGSVTTAFGVSGAGEIGRPAGCRLPDHAATSGGLHGPRREEGRRVHAAAPRDPARSSRPPPSARARHTAPRVRGLRRTPKAPRDPRGEGPARAADGAPRVRRRLCGRRGGRAAPTSERRGRCPRGRPLRGGRRVPIRDPRGPPAPPAAVHPRRGRADPRSGHRDDGQRAALRSVVRDRLVRRRCGRRAAADRGGIRLTARVARALRAGDRSARPRACKRPGRPPTPDPRAHERAAAGRAARPACRRPARRVGRSGEGDPARSLRPLGRHPGGRRPARTRPRRPSDDHVATGGCPPRIAVRGTRRPASSAARAGPRDRSLVLGPPAPSRLAARSGQRGAREGSRVGKRRDRRAVGRAAPRTTRAPGAPRPHPTRPSRPRCRCPSRAPPSRASRR